MKVRTTLTGTSPMLQHNIRLANPFDEFARAIAKITSKGSKMTDDDRHEVARLEFAGGLYLDSMGEPCVHTAAIRKCFIQTAKYRKLGTHVARAVVPLGLTVSLEYDGPRSVEELWKREGFRLSMMVGIGTSKTLRTRPMFPEWGLTADWELVTDVMNYDDFQSIVHRAGLIEGLYDNRVNGFGRFTAQVEEVEDERVPTQAGRRSR